MAGEGGREDEDVFGRVCYFEARHRRTPIFSFFYPPHTELAPSQADTQTQLHSKSTVSSLLTEIFKASDEAATAGSLDRERYVIPPHLHDLHEADLPETQRGLVISEIAQFRERAAKKERERQGSVIKPSA